ncbi:MAG: S41 family peptidase [Verrucomicrobiota bacterium]
MSRKNKNLSLPLVVILGSTCSFICGGIFVYFLMHQFPSPEIPALPVAVETAVQEPSLNLEEKSPETLEKQKEEQITETAQVIIEKPGATTLPDEDIQAVIDLLRSDYIGASELLSQPLDANSISLLIQTAPEKIKLSFAPVISYAADKYNHIEFLEDDQYPIGYLRLTSIREKDLSQIIATWPKWIEQDIAGLILDLRFFNDQKDFQPAADFLSLFVTPGQRLFSVQDTKVTVSEYMSESQPMEIPGFFPIIILIHEQTRGSGEVIAYLLKEKVNATIVGLPSAGESAVFTENKLPSGRYIRIASAQTVIKAKNLLGQPIQPDISVASDSAKAWKTLHKKSKLKLKDLFSEYLTSTRLNWYDEETNESTRRLEPNPSDDAEKITLKDHLLQHARDLILGVYIMSQPPDAILTPSLAPEEKSASAEIKNQLLDEPF